MAKRTHTQSDERQRWLEARRIFEEAVERHGEDRERFLESACDDEALRQEVEDLLRLDAAAETVLDPQIGGLEPYRIEARIGSGGMSDVYLGHRDDGEYRQQVAIKIIRGDLADPSRLQRFRNERQILADLEHPNIARLLDGGTTAAGLPYLVIEYVEGLPLDQYCDRNALSIDERLRLAQQVLGAVQFAHQNLIVHRDLKPGNILVTPEGVPKLLDFGIAKLLGPGPPPELTQTGQHLMTPNYASPEQVRGGSMTTATDVYSFGVILYELLTGRSPYVPSDEDTLQEIICEQLPVPPSRAVSRPSDELRDSTNAQQASTARGCKSPAQLRRRLVGDLDKIVLEALRKEPDRRYSSAGDFARDLGRHLRQLPVRARPDTLLYRTNRFIRRNRVPVALSCLFSLVIGVLSFTFVQALTIQVERTAQERDRAEGVADFLVELFQVSDLDQQIGGSVTARDLLDRGAERIATDLQGQPMAQATLLNTMGRIYRQLGLSETAGSLLSEAHEIGRREGGEGWDELYETEHELGLVSLDRGQIQEAETLLHSALLRVREDGSVDDDSAEAAAAILSDLATLERRRGALEKAMGLAEEALELRITTHGRDDLRVADSLMELGRIQFEADAPQEAQARYGEALNLQTQALGNQHPKVAATLAELGLVEHYLGRLEAAEQSYRRALQIFRQVLGEGPRPEVADVINLLGGVLTERGSLEEGVALHREHVAIRRQLHSGPSPYLITALGDLGLALLNYGALDEALEIAEEERAMVLQVFGDDHPFLGKNAQVMGKIYELKKDYPKALELYRQSSNNARRHMPPGHQFTAFPSVGIGRVLLAMGDPEAAEQVLRPALAIHEDRLPAGHWRIAGARSALGAALSAQGQYDEAEPLLVESLAVLEAQRGRDSSTTKYARARLAEHRTRQSSY